MAMTCRWCQAVRNDVNSGGPCQNRKPTDRDPRPRHEWEPEGWKRLPEDQRPVKLIFPKEKTAHGG